MGDAQDAAEHAAIGNAAFVLALRARGVRDTAVLRAMERIPREAFAPPDLRAHARRDIALPLPCGQSMSGPTPIATMLSLLAVPPGARVLEVGTGSGYVTALLRQLGAGEVVSLERCAGLALAARRVLEASAIQARVERADGLDPRALGEGGYDRILVNGLCPDLPEHLGAALAVGGRLVGTVATGAEARVVTLDRDSDGRLERRIGPRLRLPPLAPGLTRAM